MTKPGSAAAGPGWNFSPATLQDLTDLAVQQRVPDGGRIHSVNDPAEEMLHVVRGAVEISAVSAEGRENLITVFRAGHWWGEIGLFDRGPRTHNATARGDVILLRVANVDFLAYADRHPEVYRQIGAVLSARMRLALTGIDYLTLMNLRQRTAMRILTLVAEDGPFILMSQDRLARMVGGTREAVGRVLNDWKAQDFISTARGSLTVIDIEALRHEAEF